jgi:hypothetical protein
VTDQDERIRFSFILRIWAEDAGGGQMRWRGQITHVPSAAQRSIQSLDEAFAFVAGHLEAAGIRLQPDARGSYRAAGRRDWWHWRRRG